MQERQGNRDRSTPGVSQHQRLCDAEPLECFVDQFGLCYGGPNHITGPITVAKAGTVENDDPMVLGGQIDQSADSKS
jgi:hypothetical protein